VSPVPDHENYDAVIVGAGLAGLYQLYRLRELGLRAHIIEAGDGVGGTWYWNRYPGARCDVQSLSYSYSFSPELEQDWEWTEKYPTQPEILRYLNHVADRFDLRRDITFSTRVLRAQYDDAAARWTLGTDSGTTLTAQFVIMATGCLSASKLPEIPGLERYRGRTHHTAKWGKDEVRFDGLRVGHPVHPDHRRAGRGPDRLPAHAEFLHAGREPPAVAGRGRGDEGELPGLARGAADVGFRHPE
jgi:cyclohexanone monooxygenase